jgi:hypothetical protein
VNKLSFRNEQLARKVAWAKRENLHPNAINYAGKYMNLDTHMLTLISAYETAAGMPSDTDEQYKAREQALRAAWGNVILYMRTFAPQQDDVA